ncbi:hypothetical protein VIOR3934_19825 [Vibrio orientalis CIP 102891 = ATCC 33934]|uniref:Uncharacterized protein n=1 Tax=Vibrio orientalis CIP 102891 = ATCC 33934 TaxID=675816 RepID=C9QG01_VIBOR|nr:hypothetical protein [Vibrio orientalis]EEX94346.1 hypothetical protein VIA_001504 [Vibrio orientalis CIP 102891 = ATCC 33934]EGU54110.1 hypothetical protein VIOR3934_19825 [Vibrio orientalis CIP 102891 = ATCC 33934]
MKYFSILFLVLDALFKRKQQNPEDFRDNKDKFLDMARKYEPRTYDKFKDRE